MRVRPESGIGKCGNGEASELVSKDKSRKDLHAGLLKPINHFVGKRYPQYYLNINCDFCRKK